MVNASMVLFCALLWALSNAARGASPSIQTLAEWRFDTPEHSRGWTPNRDWTGKNIDGYWRATITGKDPILVGPILSPPLDVTPGDRLEVRCRGSKYGVFQVFFTNDIEGAHGGFSEENSIRGAVPVTKEFRTVRLWPEWARLKRIMRIRFDGPADGVFELESIAIRRLHAPLAGETEWDLRDPSTAQRFLDASFVSQTEMTSGGLRVTGRDGAPPVATLDGIRSPADGHPWLVAQMSASAGPYGGFRIGSSMSKGDAYTFPIRADGKLRTYNVWLGDYDLVKGPQPQRPKKSQFRGVINSFSVIPTYEPGGQGVIASVAFRGAPEGPPLLVVEYCGPADALYRAGRSGPIAIRIRNAGGTPARNLRAELQGTGGLTIDAGSLRGAPDAIPPDEVCALYADAISQTAGRLPFTARLSCDGGEPVEAKGVIRIDPPLELPKGVIPVPKPVKPPYDIGVYYFPGWGGLTHWATIPPFAERRPLLGYYDEGSPIAADWTIKWAVEHGVNYFMLDWYWLKGELKLEEFVEKSLLKSRFLPYIQFCVDWINHKPFGSITPKDFETISSYWIEHYFSNPQYKRTKDGRPIIVIYNARQFQQDLGAAVVPGLLKQASERARAAGFPGIYWVAGNAAGGGPELAKTGYEAATLYNFPGEGSGGFPTSPASQHIAGARNVWDRLPKELTPILPVSAGFEHRPWFGRTPGSCRYGMTPQLFERELRDAKAWLDERGQKSLIIEAWNEWGEGSCLGPHAQFGFDLLEAIPRVFAPNEAPRPAVGPADVGGAAPEIPGIWDQVWRPAFAVEAKKKPAE